MILHMAGGSHHMQVYRRFPNVPRGAWEVDISGAVRGLA